MLSRYGGIDDLVGKLQTLAKTSHEVYHTNTLFYRLDKGDEFLVDTPDQKSDLGLNVGLDIQIQERTERKEIVSSHLISQLFFDEDISDLHIGFVTRLFDPSVDYSLFDRIIFVQAENLLAAPDWLVTEDVYKSIFEIIHQIKQTSTGAVITFDTNSPNLPLFTDLIQLNSHNENVISPEIWYTTFLEKELKNREKFSYPPYNNLILLTTQSKTETISRESLGEVTRYLSTLAPQMPEISWSSAYPAKFLKRKGLFSHHLVIRYPRQYTKFFQLRNEITKLTDLYRIQVRLNPRHLF